MNKMLRKIVMMTTSLLFAAALCPGAALAESSSGGRACAGGVASSDIVAESEPTELESQATTSYRNLRESGLKFNLKSGKEREVKTYLRDAEDLPYTVRVSNLKVTKLESGEKKATFTATYKLKKLTAAQRSAMLSALRKGYDFDEICGGYFWGLVDFKTGLNLMTSSNNCGVESKISVKRTYTKKYRRETGEWFNLVKTCKLRCTVTFPASYKNACFFMGSMTHPYSSRDSLTSNWWKSKKIKFYKTQYYKKCKANMHFLRIK